VSQPAAAPIRLGLTGGIGSGKSTVARLLAQQGATVVDADAISRGTTAAGGSAMPDIVAQFGAGFADSSGALDRERMRELVFNAPSAKARLEKLVLPRVAAEIEQQVRTATTAGVRCIVLDLPLLVESGRWRPQLDRILVIDCDAETQIQRVMARSQLSREVIEKIMASQAPRATRLSAADLVLCNSHLNLDELSALTRQIGLQLGL
jgi:dephospho-CoA kinase